LGGYGKEKDLVAAHMTLRTRGVAFQVFEVSLSMATASVRPDRFMTFVALESMDEQTNVSSRRPGAQPLRRWKLFSRRVNKLSLSP
jgi:hypothetical protein